MRTFPLRCMLKHNRSKWPKVENSLCQRILSFLIRDLVPSLVILIIISLCASLVAQKIYQVKSSRTQTISMTEGDSKQTTHPAEQ